METPRALKKLNKIVLNPLPPSQKDLTYSSEEEDSVKIIQIDDSSSDESQGSVRVIQVNDFSESGYNQSQALRS